MLNAGRLQPHEREKRARAYFAALGDSRVGTPADTAAAAGVISTPVTAKILLGACANLPPAGVLPPAVFCAGVHTVVSYEFARRWAVAQGVCERRQALDLRAANARRRARGEPPFVLRGEAG